MKQNKTKNGLNPKHFLKVLLFLRKRNVDDKCVTQEEIMENLPIARSQTSFILKALTDEGLVDIEMIYTTGNTGSRKKYKLSKKGQEWADKIIVRGLREDEKRLLDINSRIQALENNNIQKDLWLVIQLFQEYGLAGNVSLFSEMVRNFAKSVSKFFKYGPQFNHESILEGNTIKQ